MRVLNLGCGNRIIAGAVNHDRLNHRPEVDVAHDLNVRPWPWPDNSFERIIARAVLEHLDIDIMQALDECHRLLVPGGRLVLKLPYYASARSYDDPTHRWFFTERSLDQFCPETRRGREYSFYTSRKWRYIKGPALNRCKSSLHAILEALP